MTRATKRYPVTQSDAHEGSNGVCLACGNIQYGGVEPGARAYPCDACGREEVHGIEEAAIMDAIVLVEDE